MSTAANAASRRLEDPAPTSCSSMYQQMVAIRLFEERVNDLYTRALMPGLAHLYIGEEAIAVGVCEALQQRRLHHQHAPRPRPLPGQGRVARSDVRGAARQGSRLLQGQGRLDAHRRPGHRQPRRQRDRRRQRRHRHRRGVRVEVSRRQARSRSASSAKARSARALLYEEMNLAQLWKLPVIFVCENNGYNEYTHFSESTAGDVAARGRRRSAWPPRRSTARTSATVYAAASKYVERARAAATARRSSSCNTYRYHGHHVGDIARAYYRPKAEEQEWVTRARSDHAARRLADGRTAWPIAPRSTPIQDELIAEMDAAVEFAVGRPYPDPSKVDQDIYA